MTTRTTADEQTTTQSLYVKKKKTEKPLRECVRQAVDTYIEKMDGHPTDGLYKLLISEVEKPLLETVMKHTGSNQVRAAQLLGINRTTLRSKLKKYQLL
jgi:Fis family transcriptional regulator